MTDRPSRLVGYVRVSTLEQASEGVSLAVQGARLSAFASGIGASLVAIYEDAGASAKGLQRSGLAAALASLERGEADGLLVTKLDRLTRSVRDLGYLVDRYFATRYALLSVADSIDTRTAGGRLVLNVLASVAQWERETIVERTTEALAHIKSQGRKLGPPSFGRNEAERKVIAVIRDRRMTGASLRTIARELAASGIPTIRGGRWSAETVRLILARDAA